MEYGRARELETRAGRVSWLLGGMLILGLVSACATLAEAVMVLLASRLPIGFEMQAMLGAGAALSVYIGLLVGLLLYTSNPAKRPALLDPDRPALASAVVICAFLVVLAAAAFAARVVMPMLLGAEAIGRIYEVQSLFYFARGLVFPIAVVIVMVMLRKR